jgi:hypothetical protein
MPALLALPLAPVLFPGTTAAAVTFLVGSSVYLADGIYGFRRPVSLPRVTGLEGVATLTEKVADYLAAARVPVGFPVPPPLQDPSGAVAGFGIWASSEARRRFAELAELLPNPQSWGLFNSKPKTFQTTAVLAESMVSGTVPAAGNTVPGTFSFQLGAGLFTQSTGPSCTGSSSFNQTAEPPIYVSNAVGVSWFSVQGACGPNLWGFDVTLADQSVVRRAVQQATWGLLATTRPISTSFSGSNATAYQPSGVNLQLPDGYVQPAPEVEAEPEALPALVPPAPLPLPGPAPDGEPLPEVEPITEPAELPALPPAIPAAPPLTAPAFPEEPRRINNSGVLIPLAPTPAAITPTDAHSPVPGGAPVGSIAKAPAATLAAIAVEVGRVEQKLERLLNPLGPDNAGDLMKLVWDAAQQIIAAQLDNREGGEYVLSSPCELDGNGDRIESTVAYPETEDNFQAVLVRLDALAALLQTHKDLKQPICRQTPAVGQPVTVNFVQIE